MICTLLWALKKIRFVRGLKWLKDDKRFPTPPAWWEPAYWISTSLMQGLWLALRKLSDLQLWNNIWVLDYFGMVLHWFMKTPVQEPDLLWLETWKQQLSSQQAALMATNTKLQYTATWEGDTVYMVWFKREKSTQTSCNVRALNSKSFTMTPLDHPNVPLGLSKG